MVAHAYMADDNAGPSRRATVIRQGVDHTHQALTPRDSRQPTQPVGSATICSKDRARQLGSELALVRARQSSFELHKELHSDAGGAATDSPISRQGSRGCIRVVLHDGIIIVVVVIEIIGIVRLILTCNTRERLTRLIERWLAIGR